MRDHKQKGYHLWLKINIYSARHLRNRKRLNMSNTFVHKRVRAFFNKNLNTKQFLYKVINTNIHERKNIEQLSCLLNYIVWYYMYKYMCVNILFIHYDDWWYRHLVMILQTAYIIKNIIMPVFITKIRKPNFKTYIEETDKSHQMTPLRFAPIPFCYKLHI